MSITSESYLPIPDGKILLKKWAARSQSGAPILLFHDSLGCIDLWRDFPALLMEATGRSVYAYDRLGFGQSDARQDRLSRHFILEEAQKIFPVLHRYIASPQLVVVGHSVGGGMAVSCAAYRPEACEAVITISAQAFFESVTKNGIEQAEMLFKQETSFSRLQRYHGEKTRWVLDAWIKTWLSGDFDQWSLDHVLEQVCCPTLAIHGELDEYGSVLHPHRIVNGVASESELVILPNTKHFPHREQSDLVLAHITQFLRKSKSGTKHHLSHVK